MARRGRWLDHTNSQRTPKQPILDDQEQCPPSIQGSRESNPDDPDTQAAFHASLSGLQSSGRSCCTPPPRRRRLLKCFVRIIHTSPEEKQTQRQHSFWSPLQWGRDATSRQQEAREYDREAVESKERAPSTRARRVLFAKHLAT
jgi:hypothetical protein